MRFCILFCATLTIVNAQAPADVDSVRARLGGTAYPRKAMDHQGTTVKLAAPAKRIVSLSNATDEYLYQIVPAERIVGVTKSAYDAEFSAVLDKVKVSHPAVVKDVESILKLKPHLVLTADSMSLQLGDGLRDAGIPVFGLFTNVTKLDQVAANIAVVGYVTGEDEGARKELDRFQREIAQIEAQCKAPHPPAKIYGVSMTGFTYGDQTLFQDVMRITGGTNIAAVNGMHTYDKVDRAMVTSWNPEWVFTWAVPGKQSEELHRWMDDPGLGSTTAAKNHRINVSVAKDVLPLSSLVTTFAHTIANATCAN